MRKYCVSVHREAHARFGCCIWQVHEQWYTSPERERIWNREAPPQYAKLGNGEHKKQGGSGPQGSLLPRTPHHNLTCTSIFSGEENHEKYKLQHSGWRPRACSAHDWLTQTLEKGAAPALRFTNVLRQSGHTRA
jgi:hypothetical protein